MLEIPVFIIAGDREGIAACLGTTHAVSVSGIEISLGVVVSPGIVVSLALVVVLVFPMSLIPSSTILRWDLKWKRRRAVIALWWIGVVSGVVLAVVVATAGASLDGSKGVGLETLRSWRGA
jgi:hypothetical protein